MSSIDWNPELYLKFRSERTQPSIDLIGRIAVEHSPKKILDIGCGPGNSSQALLQRWPDVLLTGIDNSAAMIAKAKTDYPKNTWIVADAAGFKPDTKFDIVFSNATIQWIPDHQNLFKAFSDMMHDNGVLAVQVPRFNAMPLSIAITGVADNPRWSARTKSCSALFTYHDYTFYYDLMAKLFRSVDLWETDYIHVMDSQQAVIEWIRSTGMKPYLDVLNDDEKAEFEREVLAGIRDVYPVQGNGKVLFPFKRLFMIGYK